MDYAEMERRFEIERLQERVKRQRETRRTFVFIAAIAVLISTILGSIGFAAIQFELPGLFGALAGWLVAGYGVFEIDAWRTRRRLIVELVDQRITQGET